MTSYETNPTATIYLNDVCINIINESLVRRNEFVFDSVEVLKQTKTMNITGIINDKMFEIIVSGDFKIDVKQVEEYINTTED